MAVIDGCDLVDTLDTPRLQARTNLRKLIYLLRQALPDIEDYVAMDAHALTWRKDSAYTLDVEEFERLLAVQPGQGIPLENLERAIALYGGDLLPGCYDEWIIPIRQRLRQAYLFALESAAAMHEDRRAFQSALVYAQKLAQADPLDETAVLRVMRLYALINVGSLDDLVGHPLDVSKLLAEFPVKVIRLEDFVPSRVTEWKMTGYSSMRSRR